MGALQGFIDSYCAKHGQSRDKGRAFFETMQQEAFSSPEGTQQMLTEVASGAQRLWTSGKRLGGAKEMCSMLNEAIRMDDAGLLEHAVCLVIAINQLCVVRGVRDDTQLRFPKDGVCFRGGALPDEHRAFFTRGRQYRVPGFLATSFSEDVAYRFYYNAYDDGMPAVKWVIHLDPRGERDFHFRCKHVNFVETKNRCVADIPSNLFHNCYVSPPWSLRFAYAQQLRQH